MKFPVLIHPTVMYSLLALLMVLPVGCVAVRAATRVEEPSFEVLKEEGSIQIRRYGEMVVVETVVTASYRDAGNQAFRRLFNYISGQNTGSAKIPMTAPVLAEAREGQKIPMTAPVLAEPADTEGSWTYAFLLPETMAYEDAPLPTNPAVTLRRIPARTVAVLRYAGSWSESALNAKTAELLGWLEEQKIETLSPARSASFNPPWRMPMFRRNEVWVDVVLPE